MAMAVTTRKIPANFAPFIFSILFRLLSCPKDPRFGAPLRIRRECSRRLTYKPPGWKKSAREPDKLGKVISVTGVDGICLRA